MKSEMKVTVEGDPNKVDSYAACLTAAVKGLEYDADYWYIEALTGTCFSPCLNTGEGCIGWMLDGSNSYRYEFIAKAMGLNIIKVNQKSGAPDNWPNKYIEDKALPPEVRNYFDSMKEEYNGSKYVIMQTWPAWSVLSGWSEDYSKLPFATTPGFDGVVKNIWPPLKSREYYSISKASNFLGETDVIKEALHFAYQVASNAFEEKNSEFGYEIRFGGALYDKIAEISNDQYLCSECKEHGCFSRTVKRIHDGHECSISFLKYAKDKIGADGDSEAFSDAIKNYSDLKIASEKYIDWKSYEERYEEPDFRKELADDFRKMKLLHIDATKSLERIAKRI